MKQTASTKIFFKDDSNMIIPKRSFVNIMDLKTEESVIKENKSSIIGVVMNLEKLPRRTDYYCIQLKDETCAITITSWAVPEEPTDCNNVLAIENGTINNNLKAPLL